jgi:hypothetical protein
MFAAFVDIFNLGNTFNYSSRKCVNIESCIFLSRNEETFSNLYIMRYEVLIVISLQIPGLWVWCSVCYKFTDIFEEAFAAIFHSKAECSCFLRNVSTFLTNNISLSPPKIYIYTKQNAIFRSVNILCFCRGFYAWQPQSELQQQRKQ